MAATSDGVSVYRCRWVVLITFMLINLVVQVQWLSHAPVARAAAVFGFQYAAEISSPAPESTSQGLLLLSGQMTGLLFVAGMSARDNTYLPAFSVGFVVLGVVALVAISTVKESKAMGPGA